MLPEYARSSLILARWGRYMKMPGWPESFYLFAGAFIIGWIMWRGVRAAANRLPSARDFLPSYGRLGRHAPASACPCGAKAADGSGRSYSDCCRPADVQELERQVREFIFKDWCRRSYAGRRSTRNIQQRLEDYPMPPVVLPDWVSHPERFEFPVDQDRMQSWNPIRAAGGADGADVAGLDRATDDLPF